MIQRGSTYLVRLGRRLYADVARQAEPVPAADSASAPLVDLHGRRHNYLRISLTERCNLRCQYCMPAEGVPLSARSALLTRDEIVRFARMFAELGVDKVRLTGGEPTLRKDLPDIIRGLMEIEGISKVSMTTNGLVLTRQLPALQRAGLGAINVSLDSLQAERYQAMSRRTGLTRVLAGIDLALQLGYRPVKINTVLMKGFNEDEICDFVEYTRDREVEIRFIEFMPFSGNKWEDSKLVPYRKALRIVTDRYPELMPCLPRPNDTARVWQVPGYAGTVGFISSMTQHFCSSCNRLRLTADGNLKVCLFGSAEVSLRDAARGGATDARLAELVRDALNNKKKQHAARGAGAASVLATPGMARAAGMASGMVDGLLTAREVGGRWRAMRGYCSGPKLSHLDSQGRARMVDVGDKRVTRREAEARCELRVGGELLRVLRDARLAKGDALTVAQVAGTLAAKRTSDLIPLCHPLPLDCVRVHLQLPPERAGAGGGEEGGSVQVRCEVSVNARTGAEMEALTGAALAALTLYDMCKAVDKHMTITNLRVVRKSGGKSDFPPPQPPPEQRTVRPHDTATVSPKETYAPTNFMYL